MELGKRKGLVPLNVQTSFFVKPSAVGLGVPIEWVGDGGDGIGIHTRVPDRAPEALDAPETISATCALCGNELAGVVIEGPPDAGTDDFSDFFKSLRARACSTCPAVFCSNKNFHRKELHYRLLKGFETGCCSECGGSLDGATFIVATHNAQSRESAEVDDYRRQYYTPGHKEFLHVTLDGSRALAFPPRCVICGSDELGKPVAMNVGRSTIVRLEPDGPWKHAAIWRRNEANFEIPHCVLHEPSRGHSMRDSAYKVFNEDARIAGLQIAMAVWEPRWRPRLPEGYAAIGRDWRDTHSGLTHPVWFFSMDFESDAYQQDFAEANRRSIEYFEHALWDGLMGEANMGDAAPTVRAVAQSWASRPDCWAMSIESKNNRPGSVLLKHKGGGLRAVATIDRRDSDRLEVGINPKALRKACQFEDEDFADFEALLRQRFPAQPTIDRKPIRVELAPEQTEQLIAMLDWVVDRTERRKIIQ